MKKFNASEWELYSSMKDVENAADAITSNLRLECNIACSRMATKLDYNADNAATDVYERMRTIMFEWSDFGASDTEPMSNLRQFLYKKFQVDSCLF